MLVYLILKLSPLPFFQVRPFMNASGTVVDPLSDILLLHLSVKNGQYSVFICRDSSEDKVFVEVIC
jgi:hypothetical protein